MVPYGLNQEQFVAMYQRKLDKLSARTISVIRELLPLPVGPGVSEAHIEIFLDEYGGAPNVWAYWRGKNNKVDHSDQSLFPGHSMQLALPLQELGEIDEQYFVEPDEFPGA